MQTDAPPRYSVATDTIASGLRLVTVQLDGPRDPAARDDLLTRVSWTW